jgi:hypothetical protein
MKHVSVFVFVRVKIILKLTLFHQNKLTLLFITVYSDPTLSLGRCGVVIFPPPPDDPIVIATTANANATTPGGTPIILNPSVVAAAKANVRTPGETPVVLNPSIGGVQTSTLALSVTFQPSRSSGGNVLGTTGTFAPPGMSSTTPLVMFAPLGTSSTTPLVMFAPPGRSSTADSRTQET